MRHDFTVIDGYPLPERRQFAFIVAALACFPLAILWLGLYTDIDLQLADAVFDQAHHAFPWRHAWFAATLNHRILKAVFTALGGFAVAAVMVDIVWPLEVGGAIRLRSRIVALSAALVPLVTSLLKQASDSHCPWDLVRYGGAQPYVRLSEALPFGAQAGHCLPAGHASTSLWLVSLAVFWLPGNPRKAAAVGAAGLATGFAMGWMQQLRGAHFLTHTLWSLWIAASVVLATTVLLSTATRTYTPQTTS
jgi:membrane-associated PAP2 superfamily phosphatase